jgi:hypothetical protein
MRSCPVRPDGGTYGCGPQTFFALFEKPVDDIIGLQYVSKKRGLLLLNVVVFVMKKIRMGFFGFFTVGGLDSARLDIKQESPADIRIGSEQGPAGMNNIGFVKVGSHTAFSS